MFNYDQAKQFFSHFLNQQASGTLLYGVLFVELSSYDHIIMTVHTFVLKRMPQIQMGSWA